MDVFAILQGIIPKGNNSAAASWGMAAVALAAGDPAPAIALAVTKLLDLFKGPTKPPPSCTALINPLGISRKGEGVLATAIEQPTRDCAFLDMWCSYGSKVVPFELRNDKDALSIEAANVPTLFACIETNQPPASVRYPFDRWLALIASYPLGGLMFSRRPKKEAAEARYIASWAILTPAEARKRYRLDVEPIIARAWAEGLTGEQRAQLETFYQGRFVASRWAWGDQTVAGRPLREIPRWIPLESDAGGLAAIYITLWDRWAVKDTELDLIGAINPEVGISEPGTIDQLKAPDKTRALSQAIVIAAARSKGDAKAFSEASKALESQAKTWGTPIKVEDINAAIASLGAWWQSHRGAIGTKEEAQAAAAGASRVSLVVPLIAVGVLVILGFVVARRRR